MIRSPLILLNRPRGNLGSIPDSPSLPDPIQQALFLLGIADLRWLGQGEEHDLFAGYGADVVAQAQHLDSGDFLYQRFHDRPCCFDQMGPHLFATAVCRTSPPVSTRANSDKVRSALAASNGCSQVSVVFSSTI